MGLNKHEIKAITIVVAATLAFIVTRMIHYTISIFYDPSYFLISHTILEIFSVFVSFTIFFYGWLSLQQTLTSKRLHLSLIFLAVGSFSLIHTLSYKGMPFFQLDNPYPIPTYLWIAERLVESIGFGLVMLKGADRKITNSERYIKLIITSFIILFVAYFIVNYSAGFPALIIEGHGVTPLKIGLEYIVSAIHLITLVYFMLQYRQTKDPVLLTVALGVIFVLIGGLVFTLYRNVYDMDNLLGHIYKTIGYFFILKGVFFPQIQKVFIEKDRATTRLELAELQEKDKEKRWIALFLETQEQEKINISSELHFGVSQSLTEILENIQQLKKLELDDYVADYLSNIEGLASNTKNEVDTIAFQLRPNELDEAGLLPAMQAYISRFEKTVGIHINFTIKGQEQRFSNEIETALYRIFQEALNNAAKFAETKIINVKIFILKDFVKLVVIDEGRGFNLDNYKDNNKMGFGLLTMKERAQLVNGTIDIQSIEGVGTKITAVLPIESSPREEEESY